MDEALEISDPISKFYDYGYRAYFRNRFKTIQKGKDLVRLINSADHHLIRTWQKLRDYQDEQRKKGVPIVYHYLELQADWYLMDKTIDGLKYNYCAEDAPRFPDLTPQIDVLDPGGFCVARFTNFRWRAGYPKPVNVRQYDPSKPILDHFSTKVGEKGGSNG